jgi:hypothetical protein
MNHISLLKGNIMKVKEQAETVGAVAGAAIAVLMLYGLIATSVQQAKKNRLKNSKIYVIK